MHASLVRMRCIDICRVSYFGSVHDCCLTASLAYVNFLYLFSFTSAYCFNFKITYYCNVRIFKELVSSFASSFICKAIVPVLCETKICTLRNENLYFAK